jgi:hypothetical protein
MMANQHKIVPIGWLLRVPMNIDRDHNIVDFKVIEIVDNSYPYPRVMGLEWASINQTIINLKKREMIFEVG